MVEVVIAGKGKSMGKFELGRAPSFDAICINVYDVYIIWNHDKELKAKAMSLINVWFIGDRG